MARTNKGKKKKRRAGQGKIPDPISSLKKELKMIEKKNKIRDRQNEAMKKQKIRATPKEIFRPKEFFKRQKKGKR